MAIRVTLNNPSRITKRSPDEAGEGLGVSRMIYQNHGSLIKNKTIAADYDAGKLNGEYKRILDELNALYLVKNYPTLADGITLAPNIEAIDEYLGNLGLTQEYHYAKDTVDIPNWLDGDSTRTEMRHLIDLEDGAYLTDSNGTEFLVRY